LWSTSPPR